MNEALDKSVSRVLALGRLYEFCSNKRFHLIKNEFISDKTGIDALEINNVIKNQTGINLFEAKSDKDLIEYESVLNQYSTQYIQDFLGSEQVGDELELLEADTPFDPEQMQSFKIVVEKDLKQNLKEMGFDIPAFNIICKTADAVSYVEDDVSFYLTKKIRIREKEKIVLAHLTYYDEKLTYPAQIVQRGNRVTQNLPGYFIPQQVTNTVILRMVMIFDFDSFSDLINRPITLFMKALDFYGLVIEINGIIKRFHKNVILPPHIDPFTIFYKVLNNNKRGRQMGASIIRATKIAATVKFIYCMDLSGYLVDLRAGNI